MHIELKDLKHLILRFCDDYADHREFSDQWELCARANSPGLKLANTWTVDALLLKNRLQSISSFAELHQALFDCQSFIDNHRIPQGGLRDTGSELANRCYEFIMEIPVKERTATLTPAGKDYETARNDLSAQGEYTPIGFIKFSDIEGFKLRFFNALKIYNGPFTSEENYLRQRLVAIQNIKEALTVLQAVHDSIRKRSQQTQADHLRKFGTYRIDPLALLCHLYVNGLDTDSELHTIDNDSVVKELKAFESTLAFPELDIEESPRVLQLKRELLEEKSRAVSSKSNSIKLETESAVQPVAHLTHVPGPSKSLKMFTPRYLEGLKALVKPPELIDAETQTDFSKLTLQP